MNQNGGIKLVFAFAVMFIASMVALGHSQQYIKTMCQGPDGKWYPCPGGPTSTTTPTNTAVNTPLGTSPTFTPTQTWVNTPTPTSTPTPLGMQVVSADCLSPVTFINRTTIGWTLQFYPSTNLPSSAQTMIFYSQAQAGVKLQIGVGSSLSVASVSTSGTLINSINNNNQISPFTTGMYVLPRITPTQTCVITYVWLPVFTNSFYRVVPVDNYWVLYRELKLGPLTEPVKVFTKRPYIYKNQVFDCDYHRVL